MSETGNQPADKKSAAKHLNVQESDHNDGDYILQNPDNYKRLTILNATDTLDQTQIHSSSTLSQSVSQNGFKTRAQTSKVKVKRYQKSTSRSEGNSDLPQNEQGSIVGRTRGDEDSSSQRNVDSRTDHVTSTSQVGNARGEGGEHQKVGEKGRLHVMPIRIAQGHSPSLGHCPSGNAKSKVDEGGLPPLHSRGHPQDWRIQDELWQAPESQHGDCCHGVPDLCELGPPRGKRGKQSESEEIRNVLPSHLQRTPEGSEGGELIRGNGEEGKGQVRQDESEKGDNSKGGRRGGDSTQDPESCAETGSRGQRRRWRGSGAPEVPEDSNEANSPQHGPGFGLVSDQLDGADRQKEEVSEKEIQVEEKQAEKKFDKASKFRSRRQLKKEQVLNAVKTAEAEFSIFTSISAPTVGYDEARKVAPLPCGKECTLEPETLARLINLATHAKSHSPEDHSGKKCSLGFIEFCCEPDSAIGQMCDKLGFDILRIDKHADALNPETFDICMKFVECHDFVHAHAAIPCTPWSQIQRLNEAQYGQSFKDRLLSARRQNLLLVAKFLVLTRKIREHNGTSSFEWPRSATGWSRPLVQQLIQENGYTTTFVDGCSTGLTSPKTGLPLLKPWTFVTNNSELRKALTPKRCSGDHEHTPICGSETRRSGRYPLELARILVKAVTKELLCRHGELQQQERCQREEGLRKELICVATQEETDAYLKQSEKRRRELDSAARTIHINTGHKPVSELAKLLRRQGAPPESRAAMEKVQCSTCREHQRPSTHPVTSLGTASQPFEKISMDLKEVTDSTHKHKFLVIICDATRFARAIKIHTIPKTQHKNANTEEVLNALESGWIEIFGNPAEIRHDPEGSFVSSSMIEEMSARGIHMKPVAGEAHWQNGLVERAIQTIFATATRMMAELRITLPRAVALATAAHNHLEIVHGFSPSQWALGRSPNWSKGLNEETEDRVNIARDSHEAFAKRMLEQISARKIWEEEDLKKKLQRAARARQRQDKVFVPGEVVYAWRLGTSKVVGTKKTGIHKGAWYGPATILGTETRIENGVATPGSIVWIIISDRVWRCAPQQLRRASAREHAQHLLLQQKPWTFENITRNLVVGSYRDVSGEGAPEEDEDIPEGDLPVQEDLDDMSEQPDEDEPPDLVDESSDEDMPEAPDGASKERPKRKSTHQDVVEGPRHNRRIGKKTRFTGDRNAATAAAQACANYVTSTYFSDDKCPTKAWEIALPILEDERQIRRFLKNPEAFVVTSIKKKRVEISLKNLNDEEREMINQAKGKEVREFIKEHVVERIAADEKIPPEQIMRMRWVLTWKRQEDGTKKGKARLVVLGFEDPYLGSESTCSPTLNKRSKQILLQVCVQHGWNLLKGDVTAAFLQGRNIAQSKYALAPPELAEALGLPKGERVVRLLKSVYGLTTAPIEWFQKVNEVLQQLGAEQCVTDPCVWRYRRNGQLLGIVGAHVDDFLICGQEENAEWQKFLEILLVSFRWTPWERQKFKQCGVLIEQQPDQSIIQHQEEYLATMTEIEISKERAAQLNSPVTEKERTQLRAVLGGLQWLVTQTRVDGMIDVNLLQSKVVSATVETLLSANKVLRKLRQGPAKLYSRRIEGQVNLIAWSDASWANRQDGKSTGGFLIGVCGDEVLRGKRGHISVVSWGTNKLKRVARSSMSAELQALAIAEDELHLCRMCWAEFSGEDIDLGKVEETVQSIPGTVVIDAKSIYDALTSQNQPLQLTEKRSALELLAYLRNTERNKTETRWVHGGANLADGLTKLGQHPMLREFLETSTWSLVQDETQTAGKKRKAKGLDKLANEGEANEVRGESFCDLAWKLLQKEWPDFCESEEGED